MLKIEKSEIEKKMFYLMLFFSSISYLGYYIYAKNHGVLLLVSYTRSGEAMMQMSNLLFLIIRFGKDICAVVLLLLEILFMNKSHRANIFIIMFSIIAYGTIVALFNGAPINMIFVGYRMVIYFGVLVMLFYSRKKAFLSLNYLLKLIIVALMLNTVIAIIQACDAVGSNITLIGQGSYRFMGLFPAAAAYAYFSFGAALFAYCTEFQTKKYHTQCLVIFMISLIACYISGTRSSIINLLLVIYVYIIKQINIKTLFKKIILMLSAIPILLLIIQISSNIANRGSIMENALSGGRLSIFIDSLFNQSLINIILGNGIGVGSNSAATFAELNSINNIIILDGTFNTIIYQFGTFGFLAVIYGIWIIYRNINIACGTINAILFTISIILQCFTCNILEAFSILIIIFICYYMLTKGNRIISIN